MPRDATKDKVMPFCFVGGYKLICIVVLVVLVVLFAFADFALKSQASLLFRIAFVCSVVHGQLSAG